MQVLSTCQPPHTPYPPSARLEDRRSVVSPHERTNERASSPNVRADHSSSAPTDAGLAFASLALAEEADPPLRQISGVMLKKFMDKWWDVLGENKGLTDEVRLPTLPRTVAPTSPCSRHLLTCSRASLSLHTQQKSQLLPLLFAGLSLPSSKLRSQFAFSLSIPLLNPPASSPSGEAGVLGQLLSLLAHGTQDQVHGAMRVFQEVVRKGELDLGEVAGGAGGSAGNNGADERVLGLVRGLGPVLLGVLGNEVSGRQNRRGRARAGCHILGLTWPCVSV